MQINGTNQTILAKEERLKRYQERIKDTDKTRHSKITKNKFTSKLGESVQQLDKKKQKKFQQNMAKRTQ